MTDRDDSEQPNAGPTVLLTVKEAAARLGFSGYVVDRWIRNGDLPATDLNAGKGRCRLIRIRESDLEQFIARGVFPRRSPRTSNPASRWGREPKQHV